ncbi:GNAT family N-acetyltransferase [Chromobacterium violaceum]|uniref:GNAT family N-acetyltransferase n=1 Tax=Chromobacterium violaceum TaxID=536 RepID=UPI0009DB0B7D|nr:GNAT family N-acetyltransferase [Chromobacterium violaceum]MBP4049360.1 GNAT family N-acetyltransferase [Chromobacterium violaceum]OQS22373.1 GNAT family N-acetyltransferase [Chromobacterium violaceum]QIY79111.1 GNAT family N-acetyltransferase [Chromobacterium violaceum]
MATELHFSSLCQSVSLRPARQADAPCIDRIYRSARPDLQWIDGDAELIDSVQRQQLQVLQQGTGHHYPNAMHFIVEKAGSAVGAVMVDFGPNEVRIIFLAMLPEARGQGYGKAVLQGLQQAAKQVGAPLAAVVWHNNGEARRVYQSLGFVQEEAGAMADKLVWHPQGSRVMVGAG